MFVINATDYAPITPVTPPCDIIPIFIGYKGENKARCLVFDLNDCVEEFGEGNFVISFIRHGDEQPYIVTDTDQLDYTAIWEINSTDTAVEGYGMVQLQYIVGETVCKTAMYRTVTFDSNESAGDVPDPYENLLDQIAAYAAQAQTAADTVSTAVSSEAAARAAADTALSDRINALQAAVGTPLQAATAAAMTDHDKIYIYTGSETGYTSGNWYYWNGSAWTSGGVYNSQALQTDPTLSVAGMAADAAACGELKNEISELNNLCYIKKRITWVGNTDYPTGWRSGYFTKDVGEVYGTTGSGNYGRAYYLIGASNFETAPTKLQFVPPSGYALQIKVINAATNIITAVYGDATANIDQTITIPYASGMAYGVNLGKFNGDSANLVADSTFVNQIIAYAFYPATLNGMMIEENESWED